MQKKENAFHLTKVTLVMWSESEKCKSESEKWKMENAFHFSDVIYKVKQRCTFPPLEMIVTDQLFAMKPVFLKVQSMTQLKRNVSQSYLWL